jgi:hypothetical protein
VFIKHKCILYWLLDLESSCVSYLIKVSILSISFGELKLLKLCLNKQNAQNKIKNAYSFIQLIWFINITQTTYFMVTSNQIIFSLTSNSGWLHQMLALFCILGTKMKNQRNLNYSKLPNTQRSLLQPSI